MTDTAISADDRPCQPPDVIGARVRVMTCGATRERGIHQRVGTVVACDDDAVLVDLQATVTEPAVQERVHRSQLMRIRRRDRGAR